MTSWQVFWALVWKDLRTELRTGRMVISTLALGILLILIMGMALDAASNLESTWTAGLLWLVLFFTTSLSMSRHDAREQEFGGYLGALLAPVDRSLLFYAKWFSTWLLIVIAVCGMSLAFFIILNVPAPKLPLQFGLVVAGGTLGLSGAASFFATLAGNSSMRDILVPLMLFPVTIPLFLALIRLTIQALDPAVQAGVAWDEVLVGYIVVFAVMPWLLYEAMKEV